MTDRTILRQLIDTLPDSQLDAAEEALTYLQQEKARQTMRELARVPRYDTDFYAWVWTQAAALRAQNWTGLDLEHLVEEIESLGIADEHAITRQLQRLLLHLLKWRYQPTHRTPSWRRTIRQARDAIADRIDRSPSLRGYPAQRLPLVYRRARRDAADETGLPLVSLARSNARNSGQVAILGRSVPESQHRRLPDAWSKASSAEDSSCRCPASPKPCS